MNHIEGLGHLDFSLVEKSGEPEPEADAKYMVACRLGAPLARVKVVGYGKPPMIVIVPDCSLIESLSTAAERYEAAHPDVAMRNADGDFFDIHMRLLYP